MNKPFKYFLAIAWFMGLLLIAWLFSGCVSRQVYVILPNPYQQSIDRQIALRQAEAQQAQVEVLERQLERQAEAQWVGVRLKQPEYNKKVTATEIEIIRTLNQDEGLSPANKN